MAENSGNIQQQLPRTIGKLTLTEKIETGQLFYHGTYGDYEKKVFIRAIKEKEEKKFERDVTALLFTGSHVNLIRYFDDEKEGKYRYIATESCLFSVHDIFCKKKKTEYEQVFGDTNLPTPKKRMTLKKIIRQATEGVAFLHRFNYVHRNLKPSNFLIADDGDKYVVKLSDFRTSKNLSKQENQENSAPTLSHGWIAPFNEQEDNKTKLSEDVFILGCFHFFVLSEGKHPFGDSGITRQTNIFNRNYEAYLNTWKPTLPSSPDVDSQQQALTLIKDMIKFDHKERPNLQDVLNRSYFLSDNYYKLYDLPGVKPGLCVIFNQKYFKNKEDHRYGTEKDEEALRNVFENFDFEVRPNPSSDQCSNGTGSYRDLEAEDLIRSIDDLVEELKGGKGNAYASLVVCILSHGKEGVVSGTDGLPVNIEELKKKFNSKNIPSLHNKPKIWIIQACQGSDIQEGANRTANKYDEGKDSSQRTHQDATPVLPATYDLPRPPISDFLDIRATISGYVSFRNIKDGSLLIQNLCKELDRNFRKPKKHHLEDILKKVQRNIDQKYILVKEENGSGLIPVSQTIEWRSNLVKFVKFQHCLKNP